MNGGGGKGGEGEREREREGIWEGESREVVLEPGSQAHQEEWPNHRSDWAPA